MRCEIRVGKATHYNLWMGYYENIAVQVSRTYPVQVSVSVWLNIYQIDEILWVQDGYGSGRGWALLKYFCGYNGAQKFFFLNIGVLE